MKPPTACRQAFGASGPARRHRGINRVIGRHAQWWSSTDSLCRAVGPGNERRQRKVARPSCRRGEGVAPRRDHGLGDGQ
jgi:hypothetical protein